MGKESEKEWKHTHTHIKLIHVAVHLKLTQHFQSTVLQLKILCIWQALGPVLYMGN